MQYTENANTVMHIMSTAQRLARKR